MAGVRFAEEEADGDFLCDSRCSQFEVVAGIIFESVYLDLKELETEKVTLR